MQTQRLNITLPYELARDLRRIIPQRKRSAFIADALEDKLNRKKNLKKEFIKSLKMNAKLYKEDAEDWKITEVEGWPD